MSGTMDRQIAFILAGATVALGFGGYLMSESMGAYDLDKSSKTEAARLERLQNQDDSGPGLFAALIEKATIAMETSRNVYLGEHFPPTPDGWVLKATHHDEIVDFTVDYKLHLDITDKSSMRRLSGWGGQSMARSTDLAYHKGDKVIFMRLVFANKPLKEPLSNVHAWLFNGSYESGPDMVLGGATFETRTYDGTDLINIASETGHHTGIGLFTNASLAEVEALLNSMDMYGFASQTGNPNGGTVVPFLVSGEGGLEAQTVATDQTERKAEADRTPKPSPNGNLLAGLDETEDQDMDEMNKQEPPKARKNLLTSLLGSGGDAKKPSQIKKSKDPSESAFKKIGSFTSSCQTGGGAKICRVGE